MHSCRTTTPPASRRAAQTHVRPVGFRQQSHVGIGVALRKPPPPRALPDDLPVVPILPDQPVHLRPAPPADAHDVAPQTAPPLLPLPVVILPYQHPLDPTVRRLRPRPPRSPVPTSPPETPRSVPRSGSLHCASVFPSGTRSPPLSLIVSGSSCVGHVGQFFIDEMYGFVIHSQRVGGRRGNSGTINLTLQGAK